MQCPIDQSELIQQSFHGVTVDECKNCHGKWFDNEEMRRAKDATDDDIRWLDFDLFEEKGEKYAKQDGHKQCPKNHGVMHSLTYATSKVILDQCSTCHGVWMDKNEFEKIISYLENYLNQEPADALQTDMKQQFKELLSGPEGFASELKDLVAVARLYQQRLGAENPERAEDLKNLLVYFPFK